MTSPASPITSALRGFAGEGRGGILAGLAPMLPMLLDQAAGQLREMSAQEIDGALLFVAEACLGARSSDAGPRVELTVITEHDIESREEMLEAIASMAPAHNED